MLGVGTLSVLAVFPYILTTQGEVLRELPMPIPIVFLASTVQSMVLLSISIFVGLLLGKKVGLGTPLLSLYLQKKPVAQKLKEIFTFSAVLGLLVGVSIILADGIFALFLEPVTSETVIPWQGFLASFYGGVVEELLMRFFLMTLIVWILFKCTKQKNNRTSLSIWIAIIFASVIFGIGHLPATALVYTITPLVIARAIVLNSIGGIVFGWLYWKRGLESAMIAHFFADIVLVVLLPLFIM